MTRSGGHSSLRGRRPSICREDRVGGHGMPPTLTTGEVKGDPEGVRVLFSHSQQRRLTWGLLAQGLIIRKDHITTHSLGLTATAGTAAPLVMTKCPTRDFVFETLVSSERRASRPRAFSHEDL